MPQLSPADPIVILSYARTPMGGMQGALADVSATDLGATAIKAAVERAGVDPGWLHIANSAGAIAHPDSRRDMVRVGIAMYGIFAVAERRLTRWAQRDGGLME